MYTSTFLTLRRSISDDLNIERASSKYRCGALIVTNLRTVVRPRVNTSKRVLQNYFSLQCIYAKVIKCYEEKKTSLICACLEYL